MGVGVALVVSRFTTSLSSYFAASPKVAQIQEALKAVDELIDISKAQSLGQKYLGPNGIGSKGTTQLIAE